MGLVQLQQENHTHRHFSSTCTHTHSHVILGFSHSGDHMISYQCEIDGDAATYSLHTYTLHWWWFDLHKPLRHVRRSHTHSKVVNTCTAAMIRYVSPPLRCAVMISSVVRYYTVNSIFWYARPQMRATLWLLAAGEGKLTIGEE